MSGMHTVLPRKGQTGKETDLARRPLSVKHPPNWNPVHRATHVLAPLPPTPLTHSSPDAIRGLREGQSHLLSTPQSPPEPWGCWEDGTPLSESPLPSALGLAAWRCIAAPLSFLSGPKRKRDLDFKGCLNVLRGT